jgi:phosphatidate cytidylyltransferase
MIKRILTSILFIPVIIFIVYTDFLNSLLLFLFVLLLSIMAERELVKLLRRIKGSLYNERTVLIPNLVLIVLYYINTFLHEKTVDILYIVVLTLLYFFVFALLKHGLKQSHRGFLIHLAGYAYTGVFPVLILAVKQGAYGKIFLYLLFFMVWLNDSAAYFIGVRFGKHRGFIKYSPNKSIEGYGGAFLITVAASVAVKLIFYEKLPITMVQTLCIGFLISVFAPLGDLAESILKRKADRKDSSQLLPGMGGVLDVFDSIFFCMPFYFVLVKWVLDIL